MKKLASLAMVAGLGLAASGCSTILGMFGMGGGGGSDMAAMMKDSFKAPHMVALHSGAAVGQWASWEASGTIMWWGVTGEKDGNLIVENRMGGLTYIYVVDAEGNTQEGYIANWKEDAEELSEAHKVEVSPKPDPVDAPAGPEPETGEETITAAGKDWNCKWTKVDAGGKPATSWMCDDAWFNKLIKSDYDGNTSMMLKEIGEGAEMGFKWAEKE